MNYPHLLIWSYLLCLSYLTLQGQTIDIHAQRLYHKNGQLIQKYEYYYDYWSEQEVKAGRFSQWRADGSLRYEAQYQAGVLTGWEKRYDQKGRLLRKATYDGGRLDGLRTWYRSDGSVKRKCYNRKGKRQGTFVLYNRANQPIQEKEYVQGTLISPNK